MFTQAEINILQQIKENTDISIDEICKNLNKNRMTITKQLTSIYTKTAEAGIINYASPCRRFLTLRNAINDKVLTITGNVTAKRTKTVAERGINALTSAEETVLNLLLNGLSIKNVAKQLSVSLSTAKTHLANIYSKKGVHSLQELIINELAYKTDLTEEKTEPTEIKLMEKEDEIKRLTEENEELKSLLHKAETVKVIDFEFLRNKITAQMNVLKNRLGMLEEVERMFNEEKKNV